MSLEITRSVPLKSLNWNLKKQNGALSKALDSAISGRKTMILTFSKNSDQYFFSFYIYQVKLSNTVTLTKHYFFLFFFFQFLKRIKQKLLQLDPVPIIVYIGPLNQQYCNKYKTKTINFLK